MAETTPINKPCGQCGVTFLAKFQWGGRQHQLFCSLACYNSSRSADRHNPELQNKRFWAMVDRRTPTDCWLWKGAKRWDGYGRYNLPGRQMTAHRRSWEIANGRELPEGMHVLHMCDTPACVNPAHLRIGSHKENMEDSKRKKRHTYGERSNTAKLTEKMVLELRAEGLRGKAIEQRAKELGIGHSTLQAIIYGRTWKHLLVPPESRNSHG
jgi:hypothetical protein